MTIEKLTEDERGALMWYRKLTNQVGSKALRIIDDLTERLAAAERQLEIVRTESDEAREERKVEHHNPPGLGARTEHFPGVIPQ